jgi:hypothetical protein
MHIIDSVVIGQGVTALLEGTANIPGYYKANKNIQHFIETKVLLL